MIPAHSLAESDDQVFFPALSHDEPTLFEFHDGTVRLYLDTAEFDFHMDCSARALPSIVQGYINYARRLGFMPMPYDECPPEIQEDGFVRVYLIPVEPVSDMKWEMPSLVETGMGPYSMEIPVIPSELADFPPARAYDMPTGPVQMSMLPPLPYRTEPAHTETARYDRKGRRVGRHRAQS